MNPSNHPNRKRKPALVTNTLVGKPTANIDSRLNPSQKPDLVEKLGFGTDTKNHISFNIQTLDAVVALRYSHGRSPPEGGVRRE